MPLHLRTKVRRVLSVNRLWLIAFLLLAACGKVEKPETPVWIVLAYTGSMEPTLHGGQFLQVRKDPIEKVKVNDVVLVWWPKIEKWVPHRVVQIINVRGEIGLVTKGDANPERDLTISTLENYGGVVVMP